ncbi:MAG: AzlC family ABC transporter permease [Lachnospiraceae bacterium]|nr:AzlC family ABC transporter permease [Lachnospiraceae bacterium]
MARQEQKNSIFFQGAKDGVPVALGYFAVSFAFGVMAAEGGLSVLQAVLLSLLNVTSAGQFAGLNVILAGGALAEIALTQIVINLRYALMSLTISQRLPEKTGVPLRLGMAYAVTDEIFALDAAYPAPLETRYHFGAMCTAVPGWVLGTALGAFAGSILPDNVLSALSVALYGMFLAIIIPPARESRVLAGVILLAMFVSTLFSVLPVLKDITTGFSVVLITVSVSALAALLFPVKEDASPGEDGLRAPGEDLRAAEDGGKGASHG